MGTFDPSSEASVFSSLAEQVRVPLTQIANAAELAMSDESQLDVIKEVSQSVVSLVDGFLLNVRLQTEAELQYGTISLSSLLFDVAHEIQGYAAAKGCDVELEVTGRYVPAFGNSEALKLAFKNLGLSFVDAVSGLKYKGVKIYLSKHKKGLEAGVLSDAPQLTAEAFEGFRKMRGQARQPLVGFSDTSSAGIYVASELLETVGASLKFVRRGKRQGLATVLQPSLQLSLV